MFENMFEIFNEEKKEDEETEISYPPQQTSPSSSNLFVVSIGGSVFIDGKPNEEKISALSDCLNELIRQGYRLVLVLGGGKVCRDYVNAALQLGANNFELDELGIRITRANASLLLSTIENAFPEILTDVKKARTVVEQGKTPIYGGLMPGFTTDAVAALLAEYLNARFINLSNVDGIFSADPAVHPTARLYSELSYERLVEILVSNAMKPGQNLIIDLPAAMILKRSSITAFFLNGHDLPNFKNAVQGMQFKGTVVGQGTEEIFEGEQSEEPEPVSKRTRAMASPRTHRRKSSPKRTYARRTTSRRTKKKKPARKRPSEPEEIDPGQIRF